jgi:cobalt/nickel transport system permease protein
VHIPDGFLDLRTAAVTGATAAAGVGAALLMTRARHRDRTAPLMGVVAAFVFAAQMVNFPVPGGSSGHLLGGTLAAAVLGPWGGILVIAVVLAVQALIFQDGGVTALGANVVNMGLIGSGLAYLLYAPARRLVGGLRGIVAGAVVAAWFSVVTAAMACSAQLAASGYYDLGTVLNAMLLVHVYIGVGEAAITGLVLAALVQTRPDLIYRPDPAGSSVEPGGRAKPDALGSTAPGAGVAAVVQFAVAALCVALTVAVFLAPLASEAPDGLEAAAESLNIPEGEPVWTWAPLADYGRQIADGLWAATSIAGAVGTVAVFVLAWALARGLAGRKGTHAAPSV